MNTIFNDLINLERSGKPGALCTVVSTKGSTPRREGSKMLVYQDGHFTGTIGGGEMESRVINEALESIKAGKPRLVRYSMVDPERGDPGVCGGELRIFIDPILPQKEMVIVGGGHVGRAVARLGSWLGFRVVVCDDRTEISNLDTIPDADQVFNDPLFAIQQEIRVTPWTYFILTTRSVEIDVVILPEILKREASYVGVIGSKRRWSTTRNKLIELGVAKEEIEKIHSPIGLNINAETPEEIAVSIMAQVIMLKDQESGKPRIKD
jgi:xanthine dehydrogenase accessory factor